MLAALRSVRGGRNVFHITLFDPFVQDRDETVSALKLQLQKAEFNARSEQQDALQAMEAATALAKRKMQQEQRELEAQVQDRDRRVEELRAQLRALEDVRHRGKG